MADALVYFGDMLARQGMINSEDAQIMKDYFAKCAAAVKRGDASLPRPTQGSPQLQNMMTVVAETLLNEDPNQTMEMAGAAPKSSKKKAGSCRGGCGYGYGYGYYPSYYWYQPWWWNYWYPYFQPYYSLYSWNAPDASI